LTNQPPGSNKPLVAMQQGGLNSYAYDTTFSEFVKEYLEDIMINITLQLQFPKSTSPQFPRSLAIAELAHKFLTTGDDRNTLYIAIFDNNIEHKKYAILTNYIIIKMGK